MTKNKKITNQPKSDKDKEIMVFGKKNYLLLIISTAVVIIGFLLMTGKNVDVVDVKSRQLTVAPIVVMLGFALAIYSVIAKSPDDNSDSSE